MKCAGAALESVQSLRGPLERLSLQADSIRTEVKHKTPIALNCFKPWFKEAVSRDLSAFLFSETKPIFAPD